MSPPTPSALEIHSGIVLKGRLSMTKDVVLTGTFEGELHTFGCLTVTAGGSVTGSIDAGALVLEPGNLVQARVKVGPPPRSSRSGKVVLEDRNAPKTTWSGRFQKWKEFALGRR
jgi:hypothetical protein